jgi:proteasome lid subunit RPN8/RPN11
MIKIAPPAWQAMLNHAHAAFPKECCGIMVGKMDGDTRAVTKAVPCTNVYQGDQKDRFRIDEKEQMRIQKEADAAGDDVVGFFHSHPDCDAYFSSTDLANSWPWYSNVVMSVQGGKFHHARSFVVNLDQSQADPEELEHPK